MKYKVFKFFKLSFNDGPTSYEIKPANDTMRLFNEKYLIHRKNEGSNDLEVYYPLLLNDASEPYPKLSIGSEMYFVVEYKERAGNGVIKLFKSASNSIELIEIRNNKTLFKFSRDDENATIIIKALSGIEIHREVLNTQIDSDNARHLIFSFDFTNYPFGVYTAELNGDVVPRSTFVIDKTGELKGKYALIRLVYDGVTLIYKTFDTFAEPAIVLNELKIEFPNSLI